MRDLAKLGLGALTTLALLGATGCKQKDAVSGWEDPWKTPLSGADQKHGSYGDELAKIVTSGSGGAMSQLAAKVDLASIAPPPEHVELRGFARTEATGFHVVYNPSANPAHEQYRALFSQQRLFEQVAEGLNKTVRLPSSVDIQAVDCNTVNAFYDPNNRRIIVCYELVDYFLDTFKPHAPDESKLGAAVVGAVMFSLIHEAGHGLIHQLELPAVGREEDSVDQLATLTLIAGGDDGVAMALSGASWFQLQAQSTRKTPFWDEHAFDGQRFYNILCLIYGSNPTKYDFVASGALPADRARRCPDEYQKITKAWQKLIEPHLTSRGATNVDYQPDVPVAEAPKPTTIEPTGSDTDAPVTAAESAPSITCEQVAAHAGQLVAAEAQERAKAVSPEEVDQLAGQVEAQLPTVIQDVTATCTNDRWPEATRRCVLDATALAQASACSPAP